MTYPGQSAERTAIAWGRTALAAAGLAALLFKLGVAHRSILEVIGAVVAIVAAAGFAWRGRRSYLRPETSAVALVALTAAVAAVGLLSTLGAVL